MTIDFEPDPSPAAAIDFEPDPDPKRPAATPAPAAPEDRYAAMASAPTPFAAPSVDFEPAGKMPELAYPDIDLARIVNDPSIPAEVTIGPAPTFTGEIKDGNYRNAGSMAYEVLRRPFSGLLGPTDAERSEQMVPWGKNPDGSTHYEYKPMADRLAREHGLMTSFVPTPHLEAEAGDSALTGTGKAVANTAMGLVGSFMSPAGVLLPGLGEVPQAGKAVSGLFAADMLASVPGQVAGVRDSPTVQGKVESGLGAVTGLVFGTLATGHATSGKAPAVAPELARVAAAADMPATAAEIAKGKSADPVPEPPKPNESPEPKQEPPGKSEEPPASSTPADEPISFEPSPENEGTGATPGGEVPAADVDPASVPEIHRPAFDLLEGLKGPASKRTVIEHDAEPRAPKTEPPAREAGMPLADLHARLLELHKAGKAVLSTGDWSLSSKETQAGALEVPGAGRMLQVRPIENTLLSKTPATPEGVMLQRLTAAAEKAPTEAEWDAAGRSPNQIEIERPSGGKVVVLNTREAIVKASDKYRPPSDSSHLQRVFEAVEPLKEKAPGLRVRVLRNEADLPENVRAKLNPRDAHEGIVDPDRGDVYLFSDNLRSPQRALEVFAHEVIGHYGVEKLMEPAEWQRVADSVFEESPQAARDIARKYADGKPLEDLTPDERALIAREYVARMAEKPAIAPRTWERVVQAVRTALRKLGIVKEWTEGDIRDLLRRSAREVENPQLGKKGNSASLRAVRDLGAEVGEHSPYATAIEDAFHAAVPDEAQRAAVNAYVRDKLDGKEPAALPPETAGVAERFLTYFRNKQEFAERNGVKDAASAAYADQTAGKPDMQLPDRLAIFDSEINKAVTAKTSARSETDISRAGDSKSPTSIRNAVVDEERAKRGLPPAMEPARRDFGTVWDDAMRRIDADSDAPRDLVDQLDSHPRALTDTEDAMLLHRQITLHNEYDAAARDAVRASDAGDLAGAEEARLRTAFLSDELHRLYNVGKKVGTETGRGLNARKMMAMEDYSLASMVQRKRAANGGKPLAPEVQAEVEKAASDLKTAQEKADAAEAHVETENATAAATEALKDLTRKAPPRPRKAPPAPPEAKPPAKATASWIEKQAQAARERIRQRGGRLNVGVDPFELADRVIIAAADIASGLRDFAGWAQKQLAEWGEEIKPHLNEMWNRANAMLNQHADVSDLSAKMAARVEEGATLGQLRPYVQKIATRLVQSGITELEPLLDALHPIVEAAVEGTTRRETMDLFSGYGDFKPLDKTPLKAQVRDLKGQAQQIGKLQDMKAGNAPKKTGVEQREPSDKERALIKQVEEAKKKGGFKVTDPTTQLRTALEAVKKRLRNQIVDMAARFETGERPAAKKGIEYDAEAERLRGLRDAMKKTLADLEDKPTMTEEQRARHAADAIKRGIDEYNRRLEEEDFAPKKGKPPLSTPELDALRAQRDALKAEYEEFRELDGAVQAEKAAKREADLAGQIAKLDDRLRNGDLGTKPAKAGEPTQRAEDLKAERDAMQKQLDAMRREANRPVLTDAEKQAAADRRALAGFKTRTQQRIAELTAKLAAGDFSPKPPRRALTLDADALKAKADLQRIKDEFERGLIKDRLSKRGTFERTMDGAAKWRRAFVLSGVHTIVKLASAATEIIGIAPIEEAIGGVAGKLPVVRRAAEQAPRHGGFNIRAEAEAIAANFTKLFSDFSDYARKGGTDLDAVYGESHLYPFEWKELVGRMHGALKTPARRNEFTRAYRKRLEFAAEKGADITDPLVQTKIGADAYKDAQKSIFMEDNMVVEAYKRALSRFSQVDKATGKTTVAGKTAETLLKVSLPVVRIPTNIVARTFEYTFGTVTGSFRLARALRNGIENLHPDEADLIMQNLKRGSLGAAVLLLGFLNPDNVGGYYSGKRDEKDVKPGGVKVFGHELPKLLVHNPLLEQLQVGATIRRVADSKLRKRDKESQGLTNGVIAAGLGLVEEVPFADLVSRAGRAMENHEEFTNYLADQLRSIVVPQIVEEAAKMGDKDPRTGQPVKRKPASAVDRIKLGIPGGRQTVPEAKKKK